MTQPTDGTQILGPWPAGESDGRELAQTTSHASVQTPDRGDATTHDILVPDLAETDINRPRLATTLEKQGKGPCDDVKRPPPADEDRLFDRERAVTIQYLIDHVAEFRELTEIRKRVNEQYLFGSI